jgi:hypothetical protein
LIRAAGVSPRSEVANTRADVPGGRVRRVVAAGRSPIQSRAKGGIQMAKKAAKGAKKKAAKKK